MFIQKKYSLMADDEENKKNVRHKQNEMDLYFFCKIKH